MRRFLKILILLSLFPIPSHSEIVDRIVAIVNDEIITLSEVEEFVEVEKAEKIRTVRDYVLGLRLKDRIELLIEETLIRQEAKRMGIQVSEADVDQVLDGIKKQNLISDEELKEKLRQEKISYESFRESIRNAIVRERVLQRMVTPELNLSERMLKDYYEHHKSEFATEEVRLRQIFVSNIRRDSKERVEKAYELILRGHPFEEVAREYSDEPSGKYGGDIGFVKRNELIPELREALRGKREGQITEIVRSPYGYHILKLEEIKSSDPPSFEELKDEIRRRVILEETQKRYREYVEKLKRRAYIELKI